MSAHSLRILSAGLAVTLDHHTKRKVNTMNNVQTLINEEYFDYIAGQDIYEWYDDEQQFLTQLTEALKKEENILINK